MASLTIQEYSRYRCLWRLRKKIANSNSTIIVNNYIHFKSSIKEPKASSTQNQPPIQTGNFLCWGKINQRKAAKVLKENVVKFPTIQNFPDALKKNNKLVFLVHIYLFV